MLFGRYTGRRWQAEADESREEDIKADGRVAQEHSETQGRNEKKGNAGLRRKESSKKRWKIVHSSN